MNATIQDYKEAVKNFSDEKENFQFTNEGQVHAGIVVAHLIRTASKELRIYSGQLNRDVANDSYLVKQLNLYLASGKKLYLILDELPEDNQSEALKQIINSSKSPVRQVEYKIDTDNVFSKSVAELFTDEIPHHFIVADDISFRFEIDADKYKAVCNFNDLNTAKRLSDTFDNYFFSDK